jgi:hypothetical protein
VGRSAQDPGEVEGAAVRRAELDRGNGLGAFVLLLQVGVGLRERESEDRRRLARHPVDREEVRAVRLDLDIQQGVVQTERRLQVGPRRQVRREDQDPGLVLLGDRQLSGRAEHPVRHLAAERPAVERLRDERDTRAGPGPGHEIARRHVADADDDLDGALPGVDGSQAELLRVRMIAHVHDGGHHDAVEAGPGAFDALDLDPAGIDPRRELLRVQLDRHELPEP